MSQTLIVGLTEACTPRGFTGRNDGGGVVHIPDAAILIEGDSIVAVGPRREVEPLAVENAELLEMHGKVAIPCFVDSHTHLVWGGDRAEEFNQRLHGKTYLDIAAAGGGIKKTVRETREANCEHLVEKASKVLDQMLLHGVGTIEAKSGYGLSLEAEMKQLDAMDVLSQAHAIEMTQTFMGAHEVPPEFKGDPAGYIDYLNATVLPAVKVRGTVRYVDIFCEKGVFELEDTRRHMEHARALGFGLRMHADELHPLGGAGLAAELGCISADHLWYTTPEDMAAMAKAGTIATLLPGTSFFLRGPYANAEAFKKAGCIVALSTDFNPGSSHTNSQALMMALGCMKMGMTFEESLTAVTLNTAAAIERAGDLGSLEPGKKADIAFLDAPSAFYLVYQWGINHVCDVMKAGDMVVQDRRLMHAW